MTSDPARRIHEHQEAFTPCITAKYGCRQLAWYEDHFDIQNAIQRGKCLKRWSRQWKIELIEKTNPDWRDLYCEQW